MSLSRQQLTLIGIFALFFGPVILVILMRSSWWQYQPTELKNQGTLIQPPVQLSLSGTQDFNRKWLILYVLEQPCGQPCIENVTALRQLHRAAGRNGEHLAIVLLAETEADSKLRDRLEAIYPEFKLVTDSGRTALETLEAINAGLATDDTPTAAIQTYILDPLLNVILAYRIGTDPTDIHKDLKRLLKWSDKEGK